MSIALDTNGYGHAFGSGLTIATPTSTSPGSASAWICGWVTGSASNGALSGITDSVNGAIPGAQIIDYGAISGGWQDLHTWFFYTLAGSTTARTFTANFPASGQNSIIATSFAGLAATNPLDQTPTPGNQGTGTTITTNTTGTTQGANELVMVYWVFDSSSAASWSFAGGQAITGWGQSNQFNGLGSLVNATGSQFDSGYLIVSQTGTGNGIITCGPSGAGMGCIATLSATPIGGGGGGGTNTDEFLMPGRPMPSLGGMGAAGMFAQPIALGGAMYMAMPRNTVPNPNNPLGAITCHGGYDMCLVPCAGMI